ncbi:LuxR family transcriptional regulator [Streptomyces sp. ASQP_92]|uniref:LuxR family transcriptional regulator n=1 Tax=Streptomyces sp. ASQP_92 TaxID=2979116 RepID=UPI0021C17E4B|nr:LuxR family transcriptional regulator [Streptomyces sp. ASQP_92]MCT9088790.1 LuxR family transcriptional regulator [Streptomyces sp. ASQP_92]
MEKFSLEAIARAQLDAARNAGAGRSASTVIGGHERALRQTVMALTAGNTLGEHDNGGEATLLVWTGRIRLVAGPDTWEGRDGDLLAVPAMAHTVEALEDSAFLLTVAMS